MLPTVSVIIVNWNAGVALFRCVESVLASRQVAFRLKDVVVVDNGSAPEWFDRGRLSELPVRLVENRLNTGFAAACNQGAALVDADFLLFLNPDTTVSIDAVDSAAAVLAVPTNRHVGICGIQLCTPTGQPSTCCAIFPNVRALLVESSGLARVSSRHKANRLLTGQELGPSQIVDQVIGAFFLVRSSVFKMLEGFDERFFVYYEEVDFSLRAKAAGYSSYYLADAIATHIGGACSDSAKDLRLAYSVQSRLKYAWKHFSVAGASMVTLFSLTLEPLMRISQSVLSGSWMTVRDTCCGYTRLARALIFRRYRYGYFH